MVFDFKKESKELYHPKNRPEIIKVPPMKFLSVEGTGDPNENGGNYHEALVSLYRNCARKPIPSLPGFSRGMNGACVAKHIAV